MCVGYVCGCVYVSAHPHTPPSKYTPIHPHPFHTPLCITSPPPLFSHRQYPPLFPPHQLEQVSTLIEGWRGTGAVLVNPQWAPLGDSAAVPDAYASFVNAFDMVYCFMPLAIQVRGKGRLGCRACVVCCKARIVCIGARVWV